MQSSIYFPTTIVDGFFDDPDAIRSLALDLVYKTSPGGEWPGKRSRNLFEISAPVSNNIINKILLMFFCTNTRYSYNASSFFQLIDNRYQEGWIHRDDNVTLSAIIYLTPGATSGTSIYKKKHIMYDEGNSTILKEKDYLNDTINSTSLANHNMHFEEVINVKGLYNRLVLFDSRLYHGAHNYYGDTKDTSRLTLISFIENLFCDEMLPIPRSKWLKGYEAIL